MLNKYHEKNAYREMQQSSYLLPEAEKLQLEKKYFREDFHFFIAAMQNISKRQGHEAKVRSLFTTLNQELKLDLEEISKYHLRF